MEFAPDNATRFHGEFSHATDAQNLSEPGSRFRLYAPGSTTAFDVGAQDRVVITSITLLGTASASQQATVYDGPDEIIDPGETIFQSRNTIGLTHAFHTPHFCQTGTHPKLKTFFAGAVSATMEGYIVPDTAELSAVAYSGISHGNGQPTAPLVAASDYPRNSAYIQAGTRLAHARIPFFANSVCANGDVLAFFLNRTNDTSDYYIKSVGFCRSTDRGETFGPMEMVYDDPSFSGGVHFLSAGAAGIWPSGRISVLFAVIRGATAGYPAANTDFLVFHSYSDDNGATWSVPVEDGAGDITAIFSPSAGQAASTFNVTGAGLWGNKGHLGSAVVQNGYMIFFGAHWNGVAPDGIDYAHSIRSSDEGATWAIVGGAVENASLSDYTTELAACSTGDGDTILVTCRYDNSTPQRKCFVTNNGTTWSAWTDETAWISADCQGPVCRCGNTIYALRQMDNSAEFLARSHGRIFYSVDGGRTWSASQSRALYRGPFGYSAMLPIDDESFLCMYEASTDVSGCVTDSARWYQYLMVSRVHEDYIKDHTNNPEYGYWVFNETTGALTTTGNQIKDRGNLQCHLKGGAAGTISNGRLVGAGTGIAVTLAELQFSDHASTVGNFFDPMSGEWTLEFAGLAITSTASKRLLDNRLNNGRGISIDYQGTTGTERFVFTVHDGTSTVSATTNSLSFLHDGLHHDVRFEIRRPSAINIQLRVYIDNLLAATSITAEVGSLIGLHNYVLGSEYDASDGCAFSLHSLRLTHGIRTSGFITESDSKQLLNDFYGYSFTSAITSPADIAGLVSWVGATYDGGLGAGADRYGGFDKRALPAPVGCAFQSYRDKQSGKFWSNANSISRGAYIDQDNYVGRYWRMSYAASAPGGYYMTSAEASASFDFIAAGTFTIVLPAFKHVTVTGAPFMWANSNGSNAGLYVWRVDGSTIGTRIKNDAGQLRFDKTNWAMTTDEATWYFWAITLAGSAMTMYLHAWPGRRTAPTIGAGTSSGATVYSASGTYVGVDPVTIGMLTDGTNGCDWCLKDCLVYSTALTQADLQSIANFSARY